MIVYEICIFNNNTLSENILNNGSFLSELHIGIEMKELIDFQNKIHRRAKVSSYHCGSWLV